MPNFDQHSITATAQLPAYPVPGYTIPATSQTFSEQTVYTQNFEVGPSNLDGWTAGTNSGVFSADDAKHAGMRSLAVGRVVLPAGQAQAKRTLPGLTVGQTYTVTGWAANPYDENVVNFKIGVTGKAYGTPINPLWNQAGGPFGQATYKFTATATSHELLLEHTRATAAVSVEGTYIYWDDLKVVRDAYTVTTPAVVVPPTTQTPPPLTLKVKSGDIQISDADSPYVQVNLTCAMPTIAQAEAFNPNLTTPIRVTLTVSQSFGQGALNWNAEGYRAPTSRTFLLSLRAAKVDRDTQELSLTLMSDEARLIDFARVANTPDFGALPLQASLRGVVNYVLGKVGGSLSSGTDTHVTVSQSPNLFIKPSARRGGNSASGFTQLVASGIGQDPGVDTYASVNPGVGRGSAGLYVTELINVGSGQKLEPFTTYTYSATIYGSATSVLLYAAGPGVTNSAAAGVDIAAGAFTRSSLTFTTTASGSVTFYVLNATTVPSTGTSYVAIQDAQLEKGTYASPYFDGTYAADAKYTYAWSGVADASTSTRVLKTPRSEDLLNWMPGVSAYDFLEPIIQATGYRLWCDELGVWKLAKDWALNNQINVSPANGVKVATDTRTRNDRNYWQSVVVKYTWQDSTGVQRIAYDSAGTGDLCLFEERNSPYPGPGAAGYILSRAAGKGRVLDLAATSNYDTSPGSILIVTLPDTPIQSGVVSSVTYNFPSGDMSITSKGLTDTPASAWVVAPPSRTWNTATGTWNTYVN